MKTVYRSCCPEAVQYSNVCYSSSLETYYSSGADAFYCKSDLCNTASPNVCYDAIYPTVLLSMLIFKIVL